jgi:hypothetical protein
VSTYNITITPQDDPRIQTTVSVEVEGSGRAVRVTEMTVRAAKGAGLPGARLPAVDVELLLRAILPPVADDETPARTGRRGRVPAGKAVRAKRVPPERRASKRAGAVAVRRADKAATGDMRAYRRMPDDLAERYQELSSITALAAHYGVPRHTAQGWMNRLRKQGLSGE